MGSTKFVTAPAFVYSLLQTCTEHDLPISNETSWMHPLYKHWHLIHYIINKEGDTKDISVMKARAGLSTGHTTTKSSPSTGNTFGTNTAVNAFKKPECQQDEDASRP